MPELPEVQTTVNGLNRYVKNLTIKDVWTDFYSPLPMFKDTVKNPEYFKLFKKNVLGAKIIKTERRAKNILINLNNGYTILVHLKMTGHMLYGTYEEVKGQKSKGKTTQNNERSDYVLCRPRSSTERRAIGDPSSNSRLDSRLRGNDTVAWVPVEPESLKDPFNRFVHLVFTLSNGKHLALCDARKFSKVVLIDSKTAHTTKHLDKIGPEPLESNFTWKKLKERLLIRKNWKIKTTLMDPHILAGIGNIYSDEALWLSSIHPERLVKNISDKEIQKLFKSIQEVLTKGIDFGGDSMSDYRNILGMPGKFHHEQNAYQRKGEACGKKGCKGIIQRIVVGGRSTHFCPEHQV
jgi:formamidopyrimidine-DNA glycosylase